jgi:hypothetical protein
MTWKSKLLAIFLFATAWSIYHEHYQGDWKRTINIDGIGYNAYLPALLIHDGNLSWNCYESAYKNSEVFQNRLQDFRKPVNQGQFVNKYPPGLAITQFPLWFVAWSTYGFSHQISGFEPPFQVAVFLNNLLWLFIGLWLFSKLLAKYGWNSNRIVLLNCMILFCTNLFHFITFDNSLTHPITLGFSFMGLWFLDAYKIKNNTKNLIAFLSVVVLLFLLRPVNALMIPLYLFYFLWAGDGRVKIDIKGIYYSVLFGIIALFLYLGDIKLQTGNWLVYSYQNEKFVFNEWHLGDVILGYRCGLFLYTPIIILAFYFWRYNGSKKLLISYTMGLILVAYVMSTWNEYCYGCRLGNRPMIDYFGFMLVPLIHAKIEVNKVKKYIILALLVFCTYYNQILHYQYRHFLLDWCDVKKEQFWEVFMRTNRPN